MGLAKRYPSHFLSPCSRSKGGLFKTDHTAPISAIQPAPNEPPERGTRPIDGRLHMSMRYRIIMNVITMPPNTLFVSHREFPVSARRDPTFTFVTAGLAAFLEAPNT